MDFMLEIKRSKLIESLEKNYSFNSGKIDGLSDAPPPIDEMLDAAIENINNTELGILGISDSFIDNSEADDEEEDVKVHLLCFHALWFEVDDLIKLCGGIKEDSIDICKLSVFDFINSETKCSNFTNPDQFIVVREILNKYCNYVFFPTVDMRECFLKTFYNYMPSDFRDYYTPADCNIQFCLAVGKSSYQFLVLFNFQCGMLIDLSYEGSIACAKVIKMKSPTDLKDAKTRDMEDADISFSIQGLTDDILANLV